MSQTTHDWAVIGAGPAGIAAVGRLLDHGVHASTILWIDPAFTVGDLGRLWRTVSSNTTVQLFLNFLHASSAFDYSNAPVDFKINHLPIDKTCLLSAMVEPLQWITSELIKKVHAKKELIQTLQCSDHGWSLENKLNKYDAKKVILATGAIPCTLNYPGTKTILFEDAIDTARLKTHITQEEIIAVFGSSHSAILIIKYLVDLGVKKIINFYRSPCCYAVDMGDRILFDNTGLKGETAEWAKIHIDGKWPKPLVRYISSDLNIARYLPNCDAAIYAVGFQQRNTIILKNYEHYNYNPHTGIIGPGLFGLGIAYPEKKTDSFGRSEMQVGLWKFMNYLNQVLPLWLKDSRQFVEGI